MATAVTTPACTVSRSSPLTLWHLLSLDAPCVAALWTGFLAHQFRVPLPFTVPCALGLAVWLFYAGDRIRDAARGDDPEERHRFHFRHRAVFAAAGLAAAIILALLLATLPHTLRAGWLLLAIPLGVYGAAVHLLQLRNISKEPLVALFFATATTMPLLASRSVPGSTIALVAIAFGGLCWMNCIAIARWEETLHSVDRCTAWLGENFALAAALTACLSIPLLWGSRERVVGLAAVAAAACLLLLDGRRRHLERTTLRSLADAALLTPLAVWPLLTLLNSR